MFARRTRVSRADEVSWLRAKIPRSFATSRGSFRPRTTRGIFAQSQLDSQALRTPSRPATTSEIASTASQILPPLAALATLVERGRVGVARGSEPGRSYRKNTTVMRRKIGIRMPIE
jgi:hypothetical protein